MLRSYGEIQTGRSETSGTSVAGIGCRSSNSAESPHGRETAFRFTADTAPNKRETDRDRNLGEQGRQGNIHQNTTNQRYQQSR